MPKEYVTAQLHTLWMRHPACTCILLLRHTYMQTIAEDVCDNLDHAYTLLTSKENIRTLTRGKTERQPMGKLKYTHSIQVCHMSIVH